MLGETIKKLRKKKNCSQKVVAKDLNIPRVLYKAIESGRMVPDDETKNRILDYLGYEDELKKQREVEQKKRLEWELEREILREIKQDRRRRSRNIIISYRKKDIRRDKR